MGDMLNDRDYGFEEMIWQDSAEWYETSLNENGVVVPAQQLTFKVKGKDVTMYMCTEALDYTSYNTLNIVTCLKEVVDKVHSKYNDGKIHNEKGEYIISYPNHTSVRGIMNLLASLSDLPKMQMKVDNGDIFKIRFETPPPTKFKKRMNDFGVYYNSKTQIWSAKLSPTDLEKMLMYFKKQYNLK